MKLRTDQPSDHKVIGLAPRVEGLGRNRRGQHGYALCLVSVASMASQGIAPIGCAGGVRVLWDNDGNYNAVVEDVDDRELLFHF